MKAFIFLCAVAAVAVAYPAQEEGWSTRHRSRPDCPKKPQSKQTQLGRQKPLNVETVELPHLTTEPAAVHETPERVDSEPSGTEVVEIHVEANEVTGAETPEEEKSAIVVSSVTPAIAEEGGTVPQAAEQAADEQPADESVGSSSESESESESESYSDESDSESEE